MFPDAAQRLRQIQGEEPYRDELEGTVGETEGPSAIYPQEEASILSQPSMVLEELQRR